LPREAAKLWVVCVFFSDGIERCTEWARRKAARVTAQCLSDGLDVGAMLERERAGDRSVARVYIGGAVAFMIAEENFAHAAIGETPNGAGVGEAAYFERKSFRMTAVREARAGAHGAPA
jgi:hypothetical protein